MSGNQRQTSTEDSTGKANQSGFTLVEVLVAFAILSIVLISLLEGISIASRGNFRAEFDRAALRLAKAQLEAIGVTVPLVAGVSTGRFDNGLEWALSVRPYTPGSVSNAPPAYWVEIVVRRPFDADGSSLTRAVFRRLGSPPSLTMMTLKLVRPL